MTDKDGVRKGWSYAANVLENQAGEMIGVDYVDKVVQAIDELEKNINKYEGSNLGSAQLGGFVAEDWQANTFNIRAVASESPHRATVKASTDHASVDIETNFGKDYSLKYLRNADESVKAQAKNVIQNYHEYLSKAKYNGVKSPMTFEEYLDRYGYENTLFDKLRSVYSGQGRIIPKDQLEVGIAKLKRMIATEAARGKTNRLLNMNNYLETLERLSDRIDDGQGIQSIPLTKDESMAIANLCRTGEFDPSDFGVTLDSEISREYILNKALQGGITAAITAFAINIIPELIDLLSKLIKEEQLDSDELKAHGLSTVSNTTKSFITGYISCGLYTACKAGRLGKELVDIEPGMIGTIVALSLSVMANTFEYSKGNMDAQEYKYHITRDVIISVASLVGGSISVAILPYANAVSFMIGSMVGSVLASLTISASEKILISFCIDSGYTLFGLVKQEYVLSEEILRELGFNLATLNIASLNKAEISRVSFQRPTFRRTEINRIDITILKRGIISFNRIGYSSL